MPRYRKLWRPFSINLCCFTASGNQPRVRSARIRWCAFPLTKISRKGPEETARLVGDHLVQNSGVVERYNVVKGFLNLVLTASVWGTVLKDIYENADYGQLPPNGEEIMIEYSSPNTNKPLHLGHLRNNFLGWSVSEIYKATATPCAKYRSSTTGVYTSVSLWPRGSCMAMAKHRATRA